MNRVEPAYAPGCFKKFTKKAVKYPGKTGCREQSCLLRDGVGAILAHSGNILKPSADHQYAPLLGR